MDIQFFLKNLWLWKCGKKEMNYEKEDNTLLQKQWSPDFEKARKNRLMMGCLRYGKLNDHNKPTYDRTESIKKRLEKYEKTKNKEYLVDIANMCMLEYEEGKGYFSSEDDGEHTRSRI